MSNQYDDVLKEYKIAAAGKAGEDRILGILVSHKAINHLYGQIISNVCFGQGLYTHEIDFISVTTRGVFVIEVKNWNGLLFGKPDDDKWTQKTRFGTKTLQNPIKQNRNHVKSIKELICNETKKFPIFPITVMVQNNAPSFISNEIANLNSLVMFLNKFGCETRISNKDVDMIYSLLKACVKIDNVSKSKHIYNANIWRKTGV